ncbi:MAG TPA: DUF4105 domain-containing protein, partial [Lysobacter sp.]
PGRVMRLLVACLLWLSATNVAAATPATTPPPAAGTAPAVAVDDVPRIGMVTMQPGQIFWERFGHDAIVVVDPTTGAATSYNFGFFDPGEPDFISRFVRGDMRYRLAAIPFEQDLSIYREEGRGVSVQWFDLDGAQARELAAALADNARPENAYYRYDYFMDNCSTRVRDAIDRALAGGLRRQVEGRSHGLSYRSEALRLASPAPWMWLGFDLGLGPAADQTMTLWEEAFVPRRLSDALRDIENTNGRPLVLGQQSVLPHLVAPDPQERPQRWWLWAIWGVAIGAAAAWFGRRRPRVLAAIALPFWSLCGVIGALLLFIWFGTEHRIGWGNHNLFLLSPLCWLALPGGWRALRGRDPGRWFKRFLVAIAVLAVIGLFVHWLPLQPQRNAHWIALLLPLHLGLLAAFGKR